MDKHSVLQRYYGHTAFRDGQNELIDAIVDGRDTLGVMPTGSGKSICYQIPALMADGVALVISPLISLMKDQVAALRVKGVKAAYINSTLSPRQIRTVYGNLLAGEYKIAYIAPERLVSEGFFSVASELKIPLVAIDEAHCASQWGHDFRPSYMRIADFAEMLPVRPVLAAFTATATQRVSKDIIRILRLRDPLCLSTGFDRPNLGYEVLVPKNRMQLLDLIVSKRRGQSGIVYCNTRRTVERICGNLCDIGISATRYHAGLDDEERRLNQDDFLYDRRPVMVATNAFGMGIDKPNVRYVIHYNMPQSLEAYYQEAGRAGRDGEKADCMLLYSPNDISTAKNLIAASGKERKSALSKRNTAAAAAAEAGRDANEARANSEIMTKRERRRVMKQDFRRLRDMSGYCRTPDCLRGYILDYFGQKHSRKCANCTNCR